jgi:phenylacetate-CoA ligase
MIKSKIIFYILDLFQQTSTQKFYNEFKSTLYFSRSEVKEYQKKKLFDLINYSIKNVPYYREAFSSWNKINSSDFFNKFKQLPILNRELLQKNNDYLISEKYNKNFLAKSGSSGTTGIPIDYYQSKKSLSAGIAGVYLAYSLSGWQMGDKTLHIWGNPISVKHWSKLSSKIKRLVKNQVNLASTEFNDVENYERLFSFINKGNYKSIDGYTTAIYQLAEFIERQNYSKLNSEFVFTTAENLQNYQEKSIEKNIGPVSDLYGCGEISGVAIKPIHKDEYIIIDSHVYVETIDEGEGLKSIIVTDLDNYAMPLIRYKIGDLIDTIYEPALQEFPQFSRFKTVHGRSSEIIELPNGKKILPVNIVGGTLFRKIGKIKKHKVSWNGRILNFVFEVENGFDIQKAKRMIDDEFCTYDIKTEVTIIDKLNADKNGKFKYFEII